VQLIVGELYIYTSLEHFKLRNIFQRYYVQIANDCDGSLLRS